MALSRLLRESRVALQAFQQPSIPPQRPLDDADLQEEEAQLTTVMLSPCSI